MRHNYILDGENKEFSGNYAGPKARNDLIQIFSDCRLAYLVDGRGIGQLLHYLKLGLQLRLGRTGSLSSTPLGWTTSCTGALPSTWSPKRRCCGSTT